MTSRATDVRRLPAFGLATLLSFVAAGLVRADEGPLKQVDRASVPEAAAGRPFKFTVGDYRYTGSDGGYSGTDVNLRWRREHAGDSTDAWVGIYRDRSFGTQARAGWDDSIDLGRHVSIQPSVQVASRGFIGGSLTLQAGDEWFGLVGIGRTNKKSYFNLNFDPNDAITLGAGHRFAGGSTWTAFVVSDDRLHTHQKDFHLDARVPIGDSRLSLDLLRKTGDGDAGPVAAWGWSATWDQPAWFVRLARDPKQNFAAQDAWRVAGGFRF